jgi:putative ABC transport system permease protein
MMTDLRFALRQLRKSPGFTFLAVITLTLGIGLNTAIFSLINDLFLKGLPFQEPDRILHIFTRAKDRTDDFPMSAPRFMLYRDGQTIFSGFAAENRQAATVTGLGDPLSVPMAKTTANWFDVLGVRPIMGRTFLPQEEEGADVAIITDRFWKARFAGSEDIIGKTIVLDGVTHTIVGVIASLPVSWTGTPNANIWTTKPMAIPSFSYEKMMRGSTFLRVVGRLKAGVTLAQAKAALGTLEDDYEKARVMTPDLALSETSNLLISTARLMSEDVAAWQELYGRKWLSLPA